MTGGKEGGWMSNEITPILLPSLSLPFLVLWSGTTRGVQGDAVAGSPQRQDPEATVPACVLCLEEYMILFICLYISGSRCSCSLLPCRSASIHAFIISNNRNQKLKKDRKRCNVLQTFDCFHYRQQSFFNQPANCWSIKWVLFKIKNKFLQAC